MEILFKGRKGRVGSTVYLFLSSSFDVSDYKDLKREEHEA
jgi:hypothetical protein